MFPGDILERNRAFTLHRQPEPLPPAAAMALAVVTCFDPRLDPLLRPALGLAEDEGFFVRTAGALLTPGDRTMRALAVAVYLFEVRQVLVLGHSSCRMAAFDSGSFIDAFRRRGTPREAFGDDDLRSWAGAIASPHQGVLASAAAITEAAYLPRDLLVAGALLDDTTGEIRLVLGPEESAIDALAGERKGGDAVPAAPAEVPPLPVAAHEVSPALETIRTAVDFLASQPQMSHALDSLDKALRDEGYLKRQLEHVRRFIEAGAGDLAEVREAFQAVQGELRFSTPTVLRRVILPLLRRPSR
jgi:carbonic anhydrase